MFTGIIQHCGVIEAFERRESGALLRLRTTDDQPYQRGESVAINGVCLTVIPEETGLLAADLSHETLLRTALSTLATGTLVNVERSLSFGDRMGGHLVQGHVDAVGTLASSAIVGEFAVFRWSYPPEFRELIVTKGSIAVDGVSLTVVEPDPDTFGAALIPETLRRTTLGTAKIGSRSNLEFDIIAKYVRSLLTPYAAQKAPA